MSDRVQCSSCDRECPDLQSVVIKHDEDEFEDHDLVAVTFHVRCDCGNEIALQMRTDGEEVAS